MRRTLPLLLGWLLSVSACGGPEAQTNLPPAPAAPLAGLETAEIRQTVVTFLETYARTGSNVDPLRRLVAGAKMEDWVHWLGVQNRGLGLRRGRVDLSGLRVLDIEDRFAAVAVEALVTIVIRREDEEPIVSRRLFQTPLFLGRSRDRWLVLDATRDGRSMEEAIALLRPPITVTRGGVTVELASVFRFSPGTVVNLRIRNASGGRLTLNVEGSALALEGRTLPGTAATPTLTAGIPNGAEVEGGLNFAPMSLLEPPQSVSVSLEGRKPVTIVVEVPADAFSG